MKVIDFDKYDLTDPNITGDLILKAEGVTRNTLYRNLNDAGISLAKRGITARAKQAMTGRKWKRKTEDPFTFYMTRCWKQWACGARSRGLEFDISYSAIIELWNRQNGKCIFTGEELVLDGKEKNISLDRIDSSGHYCIENVQLSTITCNYMKQALSQTDFVNICRRVASYHV